jgi:hypothetical protein
MFYPCQYVSYLILLNDANTTLTNPLKLAHKVMDHKRKAPLDSGVYHYFFVFLVMPLSDVSKQLHTNSALISGFTLVGEIRTI